MIETDERGEHLRAGHVGHDAPPDLERAEPRIGRDDTDVGAERELQATTECGTVDRGNHRDREVRPHPHHPLRELGDRPETGDRIAAGIGHRLERREVEPGAEAAPYAGQHDCAHRRVVAHLLARGDDPLDHGRVERVDLLGRVRRTSATPPSTVTATRSATALLLPRGQLRLGLFDQCLPRVHEPLVGREVLRGERGLRLVEVVGGLVQQLLHAAGGRGRRGGGRSRRRRGGGRSRRRRGGGRAAAERAARRWCRGTEEDLVERAVDGLVAHRARTVGEHRDELELGVRPGTGAAHVERPDVHDRIADRDELETPGDDARVPASEQRDLLGDRARAVDLIAHLHRPQSTAPLRHLERFELPVLTWVRVRGEERREAVDAVPRRHRHEGLDHDEVLRRGVGELQVEVVGSNARPARRRGLWLGVGARAARSPDGPEIGHEPGPRVRRDQPLGTGVVEPARLRDVVAAEGVRLHRELVFGVPEVCAQTGRHLRLRREQIRERLAPRLDDRIVVVPDVERDRALIRVDGGLDRVPHIVEVVAQTVLTTRRLRVGVHARGRVAVEHPDGLVPEHDRIGVTVEAEERRELGDACLDVTVHQQLGARVDLAREQQVEVTELEGERSAA